MTRDFICVRFRPTRREFLQPTLLYSVKTSSILAEQTIIQSFSLTAPAIRLVDEMGHEVSDRYYKLGSSVDVTCQVALSFLNTIPSPITTNTNDRLPVSTTRQIPTTTTFPFIDINLIRRTIEQQIPYSGKHKIKWKKDGKELPKDIKINLRFVRLSLLFWPCFAACGWNELTNFANCFNYLSHEA